METNQQCSIGILLESQCHQTTYSKTVSIEPFDNLPREDREILMWRTGPSIINSNPTTSLHHKYVYLKRYASKQTRYCDPFDIHSHKKVIVKVIVITRDLLSYRLDTALETVVSYCFEVLF